MTGKLDTYRSKRDFRRTAEPAGAEQVSPEGHLYVMHKHAASHDHFDLRLEQEGVLRSWALPKGPSLEPGEKRLAVEVEDHPLEYGRFEGVIPRGEYGGGTVMLWDTGYWQLTGTASRDKLDFEIHGEKLKGRWSLVRMHGKRSGQGKKAKNWLLIKRSDSEPTTLNPDDLSVVSGRNMEEIARQGGPDEADRAREARHKPEAKSLPEARKNSLPKIPSPQLATLVDQVPEGIGWLHEIKFDGYRLMGRIADGRVRLYTRNGKDWTGRFPEIAGALKKLPVDSVLLDGEVISIDRDGASSFRQLQEALGSMTRPGRAGELIYEVFDLLYLDGYDLQRAPQLERKRALAQLIKNIPGKPGPVRYSDHVSGQGGSFYAQVCELGLEGMVSKKSDASYREGRNKNWVKAKCTAQDEFVVGGYSPPAGSRVGFGALLLGSFSEAGLVYIGRVGSGFSTSQLNRLHKQLKRLQIEDSPFCSEVPEQSGVQWVKPEMVVDVEFTERTRSGALRHPVFRGVREDKEPSEVKMSDTRQVPATEPAESDDNAPKNDVGDQGGTRVAGVRLSSTDRILYPQQGVTKLELARYYEAIADWILPHLAHRPLSLLRCPEGREQACFFQKHPGKNFAKGVPRIAIEEKRGTVSDFLYIENVRDLVELVQFNVLEFHPWGSRIEDIEAPDTLIFDLDPGPNVAWGRLADAASQLHQRLVDLGLTPFLQATGGKGLHLVVPIETTLSWGELKAFARAVSQRHAREDPEALTTNMAKSKRQGRIFIDYLRNDRGNTAIARYSTRARENAPVATPLRWDELTPSARSNRYTLHNIRRRLGALKADPWADYEKARTAITADMRRQVGMD